MFETLMCVGFFFPVLVFCFHDLKDKKLLDIVTLDW
jgi:hypothetical protein